MTKSSTSLVTNEKMRSTSASLGLPEQLVTDNSPSFTSEEFRQFMQNNGVQHLTTSKGPVSYTVKLEDGGVCRRHMDHLRACIATAPPSVEMDDYPTIEIPSQNLVI